MNTIDITPIVNAALALIGAGVSVFLIPWLKKQTTEAHPHSRYFPCFLSCI